MLRLCLCKVHAIFMGFDFGSNQVCQIPSLPRIDEGIEQFSIFWGDSLEISHCRRAFIQLCPQHRILPHIPLHQCIRPNLLPFPRF